MQPAAMALKGFAPKVAPLQIAMWVQQLAYMVTAGVEVNGPAHCKHQGCL
jgi:hypothetical protein